MAEAADQTESGENARRMAVDPDDHINVKEYLQTKNEEWDRLCGKFPPNDDVFMRGYLERQFCRWSHFRGYDFDSIKMRPFPEFDRNGKIDLDYAKSKSSFRYVIGFSRPCDSADIQFLLHCINVAVQKGKRKFPAAIHTRVHINGSTHGDKTGGYVYVRAPGKKFYDYKKDAFAFSKKDQQLLDNCGLKGSSHNCTKYDPALYPLARFIINAWCYSADGFYGGLYIPWGRVAMLFGSNDIADMDDKFKKLKPINNDGKRMQTKGKCANKKCIGDALSLRRCQCEACIKVDPNGRLWCKKQCICTICGECHPDNSKPCTHCNNVRDGEAGEGTIGKQSFDKLFASFERKQSMIISNDLEKYLEKFQLNEAQTHASNVKIYQPSICSDTQKTDDPTEFTFTEKYSVQCKKSHEMIQFWGLPKSYHTNARCDVCKTGGLQNKGWFYHCESCEYDLCQNCTRSHGSVIESKAMKDILAAKVQKPTQDQVASDVGDDDQIQEEGKDTDVTIEDFYQVFVYHHEDWFKNTTGGHYKLKKGGKLLGTRNWDERKPFFKWLDEMRQTELRSGFGISKKGPWELAITQEEWESYWVFKFGPFDD